MTDTKFASFTLPLWYRATPGEYPGVQPIELHLDGNSKITASAGSFDKPVPNSFSLPEIDSCPGATPTCKKACYVQGLAKHAPHVHAHYRENFATIKYLLGTLQGARAATILADHINATVSEFRWHTSGDVFSRAYARWIVDVCRKSPDVTHWIYTRSFQYVPELVKAENLVVNLSADKDNYPKAWAASAQSTKWLRICYMTQGEPVPSLPGLYRGTDVVFPDKVARTPEYFASLTKEQKHMVCPADMFGQSEHYRCGPCRKCMVQSHGDST